MEAAAESTGQAVQAVNEQPLISSYLGATSAAGFHALLNNSFVSSARVAILANFHMLTN